MWGRTGSPAVRPFRARCPPLHKPAVEAARGRVALTDAGRVLLPEARATLAAAQAARDAIREARAGLRGTLTIGTMQSIGRLDLPALLGRFYVAHPGVLVRLRLC